ncbi:unnamed protein product [Prorocentrum cordatum]|uniref:SET domain-containing protein n=1 Tax=Prorocentrum cordatum TaxID=2364126 RepID=A0ABN9TX97_9DINO|nr:unnamed protein product [Polarella glacialis]
MAATADWPEVQRLHGILNTNAIKLGDGCLALYRTACLASHSCAPSCEVVEAAPMHELCGWAGHPRAVMLRARRPLQAGDQVGDVGRSGVDCARELPR